MKINFRNISKSYLSDYIPGEKRVYSNIFNEKVAIIMRKEKKNANLQPGKLSTFIDDLNTVGIKDFNGLCGIDAITSTNEPISATTFVVKDGNGCIERLNVSLRSGNAVARYKFYINSEI